MNFIRNLPKVACAVARDYLVVCKACGRRPFCTALADPSSDRILVAVRCDHGARAVLTLPPYGGEEVIDRMVHWLDHVFDADCHPDVMELLRMNAAASTPEKAR